MKIHYKRELQNIATNHSADIDSRDFMKIYKRCTIESYSFLNIDTTKKQLKLLHYYLNNWINMNILLVKI